MLPTATVIDGQAKQCRSRSRSTVRPVSAQPVDEVPMGLPVVQPAEEVPTALHI